MNGWQKIDPKVSPWTEDDERPVEIFVQDRQHKPRISIMKANVARELVKATVPTVFSHWRWHVPPPVEAQADPVDAAYHACCSSREMLGTFVDGSVFRAGWEAGQKAVAKTEPNRCTGCSNHVVGATATMPAAILKTQCQLNDGHAGPCWFGDIYKKLPDSEPRVDRWLNDPGPGHKAEQEKERCECFNNPMPNKRQRCTLTKGHDGPCIWSDIITRDY